MMGRIDRERIIDKIPDKSVSVIFLIRLLRLRRIRPSVAEVDLRPTKAADKKVWFNSPEPAPELMVQGLPWDSYQ